MVSRQAQKRLNKEYKTIQANPPPFIEAKPNDENILEWHFIITGPPSTPYENGQYHGLLRFPSEYPFAPPAISMVTPNGRFACNTRLCLSMSDYHPDTWNPAWSVSTILTGLLSFMTGEDSTTGSINTSESVKRRLARDSKKWNNSDNTRFRAIFPDLVDSNKIAIAEAEQAQKELEQTKAQIKRGELDLSTLDPEDRARIQADHMEKRSSGGFVVGGVLLVAVVMAFIYY
ncbi:uncharacterized protein CXQ87_003695 [Candidozyma duobushaemuli]|uniref:UBC core domain-containing protein n=2 Tax=Candidozyma TaxID=3303203 RepID=A0ABX8I8M2_9ASCO|nr:uncharacterized protein CXQ87_003695 [[Candida] duobushaemulonis]PVH15840.1 hypothetical protein CXQ87_003695 [[Candida] duobushaemulonis]QWU89459.1 hypothetical protein CA3LBN_003782 [[Candida] haemuloni]